MAIPLGGKTGGSTWEFITPTMVVNEISFKSAINRYPDVDSIIANFKKYVDERPFYTFERNFDSYWNDCHVYECRILSEPKYLRIVRPYAKRVHQLFVHNNKETAE